MSPASSRWCPTPEQLMILEEMYRSGIRTPNASQIQQITAHLSRYGKIEGKNVFYWFQNHKARERQKFRRKLSKQLQQQQLYHHFYHQHQHQPWSHQSHHLLHCLQPTQGSALQQVCCFNSACFLPHQGMVEDATSHVMKNHTCKQGGMQNSLMELYSHDWMMMRADEAGSNSPCCKKPIKTLELFPVKSTNLKEECKSSSSNQT